MSWDAIRFPAVMRHAWAAQAVGAFIAAATEKAGGQEELLRRVNKAGFVYRNAKSISDWKTKGNAPAAVVFAIARDLELSVDARVFEDGTSLAEQVEQNARDIAWLTGRLQQLAVRTGNTDVLGPDDEASEAKSQEQDA